MRSIRQDLRRFRELYKSLSLFGYFEEQGCHVSVVYTDDFIVSSETEGALYTSGKGFQQCLRIAEWEDIFPHELDEEFGVVDLVDGKKSDLYGVTV